MMRCDHVTIRKLCITWKRLRWNYHKVGSAELFAQFACPLTAPCEPSTLPKRAPSKRGWTYAHSTTCGSSAPVFDYGRSMLIDVSAHATTRLESWMHFLANK
eukprot:2489222-Amphidinium_carterae.1